MEEDKVRTRSGLHLQLCSPLFKIIIEVSLHTLMHSLLSFVLVKCLWKDCCTSHRLSRSEKKAAIFESTHTETHTPQGAIVDIIVVPPYGKSLFKISGQHFLCNRAVQQSKGRPAGKKMLYVCCTYQTWVNRELLHFELQAKTWMIPIPFVRPIC